VSQFSRLIPVDSAAACWHSPLLKILGGENMTTSKLGRFLVLTAGAVLALGPIGCSTMNQTEKGALGGGAIGAGVGTLVGAATGNPKTGAAVGGLLGAGVGGVIGNEADRKDQERVEVNQAMAQQAYVSNQPGRVDEIIRLTQNGHDESVILNHIDKNRMTFQLSVEDLNLLKSNNVAPRVISAMQNSGRVGSGARPRPVVVREQVVVREPVYMAAPPPVVMVDPYAAPAGFQVRGRFR
jgi:uncharacterized protein YcfJ